uniref:Uncharacterized protein n=1 Tax=Clytia hemisphaerica TaxID=252671 RepID=A0A7M5XLW9_9CNID
KEISQKAMVVAEKSFFQYANGISKPPQNFPSGPSPVYTKSFDEAVFRVRLKTKKGILLVSDDVNINLKTNEKVKYYHCNRSDFSDAENPIDFISEGNILVTSRNFLSGFEWPVVIYQLNENDEGDIERHECNIISRCTSMLVIVGTDENLNLKSFPFTEISSLLEISTTDELYLSNFKDCLRKYIIDHIDRFNRRDWLQGLLPILKTTIEHISEALNNTIAFPMLEDILLFMLTDLSSQNDKH